VVEEFSMSIGTEKRAFPRYLAVSFPVLIDPPSLSDVMLDLVDVSLGGYRVVVTERPAEGDRFDCSVEIKGKLFPECRGKVARVIENKTDLPIWFVGMSLHPAEDQLIAYEDVMNELFSVSWKKL
jgi:hypothetical protein